MEHSSIALGPGGNMRWSMTRRVERQATRMHELMERSALTVQHWHVSAKSSMARQPASLKRGARVMSELALV